VVLWVKPARQAVLSGSSRIILGKKKNENEKVSIKKKKKRE
jgi:hypothetical protein